MSKKTKILILIAAWILLFSNNENSIINPKPEVNVGEFISDFESMAYAGTFQMLTTAGGAEPDEVVKCTCNGKGKVSYDGGASWTDCPCKLAGGECKCKSEVGSVAEDTVETVFEEVTEENLSDKISPEKYLELIKNEYFIAKATSKYCQPCKQWDSNFLQSFKDKEILVKEFGMEDPNYKTFFETADVDQIPKFYVCTKIDNVFYTRADGSTFSFVGSNFNTEDAIKLMVELTETIHPSINDGKFYLRKSKVSRKLFNKDWANKEEYKSYLSSKLDWNLDGLSTYELKAIHDDLANNELGELNEI